MEGDHRARRGAGDLAVSGDGEHGHPPGRGRLRPAALERAGDLAPRDDDLHDRRRLRDRLHARPQSSRHGPGDVQRLETDPALGHQHPHHQPSPVEVRRGRAPRRRLPRGDRSHPHAHGSAGRRARGAHPGHGRRARAGPPQRGGVTRQGRPGVHRGPHHGLGSVSRAHPRIPARARGGDHWRDARADRRARRATGHHAADRHPPGHGHAASRRRRHGRARDHLHSRRHRRLALSGRRRSK